jgi:hypothetical protein
MICISFKCSVKKAKSHLLLMIPILETLHGQYLLIYIYVCFGKQSYNAWLHHTYSMYTFRTSHTKNLSLQQCLIIFISEAVTVNILIREEDCEYITDRNSLDKPQI